MANLKPKRMMTVNWDDLACNSDEEGDEFFESNNRMSSVVPLDAGYPPSGNGGLDLEFSDDDDDDDSQFEDTRMSFTVQSLRKPPSFFHGSSPAPAPGQQPQSMENYGVWMAAPGSITERRKRLLQGMGINSNKDLSRLVTMRFSKKYSTKQAPRPTTGPLFNVGAGPSPLPPAATTSPAPAPSPSPSSQPNLPKADPHPKRHLTRKPRPPATTGVQSSVGGVGDGGSDSGSGSSSSISSSGSMIRSSPKFSAPREVVLFRSRSDGDMDSDSFHTKQRREEMIGRNVSKQRLTRTASTMAPLSKMCRLNVHSMRMPRRSMDGEFEDDGGESSWSGGGHGHQQIEAFFLIKNLDTGKEFIVKEFDQDGMWNRLSDMQTGKQLTMDEFEKTVGYSPVVKELMRRQHDGKAHGLERKMSAAITKSFRYSKKRGASLLKNIKSSVSSSFNSEKDIGGIDQQQKGLPPVAPSKGITSSEWVKVRQQGKTYKELTALRVCQEIQAHEGSIWTMRFNASGTYLASAGEDKVIHVWEVQECEIATLMPHEDEDLKKGKSSVGGIPDYVQLPDTAFGLSEKPHCSFTGHLDDVLDVSWSTSHLHLLSSSMDKTVRLWDVETKACLKLFAHNDYVTCIQFNPVDDKFFISGSLDAKIRIWNVPGQRVVDWLDVHEMVTAACYSPDGQSAIIGSHKGSCRMYNTTGGKLSQLNQFTIPNKTKKVAKITGFEFTPDVPSEILVTAADSRIRIYEDQEIINKFFGFQNTSSQIAASYSPCGKHVVCASEDSHVYVWKREEPPQKPAAAPAAAGAPKIRTTVQTRAFEQFQCKDVSVAIPWPGSTKFEAPTVSLNPKKTKPVAAPAASAASTAEAGKKPSLPPLPKKGGNGGEEKAVGEESEEKTEEGQPASPEMAVEKSEATGSSNTGQSSLMAAAAAAASPVWAPGWAWLDVGGGAQETVQATAWGMVIVTAGLGGEIKAYQNLGLPMRIGRQKTLFS